MPYQPSQIDTSGQIRGRGIAAFGTQLADGFTSGVDEYNKNKFLTTQSTAKFEGAMRANPELEQFLNSDKAPTAAKTALAKLHKDGAVGLKDATMLAQVADSYTSQKQQMQEAQMKQQQAQLYQQQAAEFAQRVAIQKKAEEDSDRARIALADVAGRRPPAQGATGQVDPGTFVGSPFAGAMVGAPVATPNGMAPAPAPAQQQASPSFNEMAKLYAANRNAPLTPDVDRFFDRGMMADDRAAAVDARETATNTKAAAAIAEANARAATAQDKLKNAKGEYSNVEDALMAGQNAIKKSGATGANVEVVNMPGGTYAPKITKPYADHGDVAVRAKARLDTAEDDLALAQAHGTKDEVSRAEKNVKFWKDRAEMVSTRPPNAGAIIAVQLANGASGAIPAPAATNTPRTVKTQAEYDALPPGSQYIGPDGQLATKRK